jgi:hypothetical protein
VELEGTVRNGVIVVDHADDLPDGTKVKVLVESPQPRPSLAERLLKHAGTVPGLPSDLADQHDHYVHGTPKR